VTICALLLWLILLALLLALWAFGGGWLLARPAIARAATSLCPRLCRIAVVLALLFGIALGIWLCMCGPALWRLLREADRCRLLLVLVVGLLVVALVLLVIAIAACKGTGAPVILRGTKTRGAAIAAAAPAYALPVILVVLFYAVLRCCGIRDLRGTLFQGCALWFGLVLLLGLLALLLYLAYLRHCRPGEDPRACRRIPTLLVLATALALLALGLIRKCCDELSQKDYDLAMVGIWWDGQYEGEAGAHLRWAFRYGLPFPPGGFDLYRRPSSGGSWTALNGAPIRPADVWSDGAPAPGPMWQHRAVDRLHTSRWSHFTGQPFDDLHAMVGRPPFAPLFFVQEPDDPAAPVPTSPYATQADVDAYLATYNAVPDRPPLAQWDIEPMTALQVSALHPDIARLLGLFYIDTTAAPETEYDYRVVGHWADGDRSYTVTKLSRPNTAPLAPTPLSAAQTPVSYPMPAGPVTDDRAVGLRWPPPTTSPTIAMTAADGIKPVRYQPRRRDLGARPCPPSVTPGPDYVPIERAPGELVEPVAVTPRTDGGALSWPTWFFIDHNVDYRCYGYAITGVDVFGRESALSNALLADVVDRTGPPPPPNVEATVFQRVDAATLASLTPAERAALFPPGSTHASAMRVSWIWPNDFLVTVPDTKEFRLLAKIAGYAAFAQPANRALWPSAANWDPTPIAVPIGAGQPLPPRLVAVGVVDATYYEAIWFDPPIQGDDDTPVGYGWAGIAGVDHSPFNNVGTVSPPVVIVARDFEAPDPPAVPVSVREPEATDGGANALLAWTVAADARYLYQLASAPGRRFATIPNPTGTPPACLAADTPTCTPGDPVCDEQRRRFRVRWKAALHPELFGIATLSPGKPEPAGPGHQFATVDKVDATAGDDHLYAGIAIDRAGNRSAQGCPQLVVVKDSMAPRPPAVSKALGLEGAIRVSWTTNPEVDLVGYRLYRTADAALDGSLDRMTLAVELDAGGVAIAPAGAPNATSVGAGTAYRTLTWEDHSVPPARDHYYRLVAIDSSANISKLSASARARSVDTTPPGPPAWSTPAVTRGSDATGAFAELHFVAPAGDTDARFRVQRQETGVPFWSPISAWLDPGTTSYVDRRAAPDRGYTYRVQAMDVAGNIGNFSAPRSAP
jgi:hypothetical protein